MQRADSKYGTNCTQFTAEICMIASDSGDFDAFISIAMEVWSCMHEQVIANDMNIGVLAKGKYLQTSFCLFETKTRAA